MTDKEASVYNEEQRDALLEDGEISPEEEGFMRGYEESEEEEGEEATEEDTEEE
jgi:hypothetical protein